MANVFLQFLHDAEHGDIDAVRRNIENGIDLEARDEVRSRHHQSPSNYSFSFIKDQQTALILAARCNHFECVKVLLQSGADVNAQDVVRRVFSLHLFHFH